MLRLWGRFVRAKAASASPEVAEPDLPPAGLDVHTLEGRVAMIVWLYQLDRGWSPIRHDLELLARDFGEGARCACAECRAGRA